MGLLDQVHSFAQGASNGVAGSLTGPVDGLAWLLRKAGVPVPQAPLGGSDWMRNVGLMQEPKERMAGLLGEGIGSALPTVIAGKAPQIANGLLQMERNAMAPRTLNPQTGAIVWHGSPHKFDKFDSSKIGTGEGAQAYGHGLYLAEHPETARHYQVVTSSGNPQLTGKVQDVLKQFGGNADKARAYISEAAQYNKTAGRVGDAAFWDKALKEFDAWSKVDGSLYKVDLPDDAIAKMLDWDKPLSQQHPDTALALEALRESARKSFPDIAGGDPTGRGIYSAYQAHRGGNQAAASDKLRELGIPGIRYLDGGSRGAGAGTSNFVVFPGNEGLLKILERNGQGLLGN